MSFTSNQISRPETRWAGSNRGGWSNPDYDRLARAYETTLEPDRRAEQLAQITRTMSEQLPVFSLYFDLSPTAISRELSGPREVGPNTSGLVGWNIVEWELRR